MRFIGSKNKSGFGRASSRGGADNRGERRAEHRDDRRAEGVQQTGRTVLDIWEDVDSLPKKGKAKQVYTRTDGEHLAGGNVQYSGSDKFRIGRRPAQVTGVDMSSGDEAYETRGETRGEVQREFMRSQDLDDAARTTIEGILGYSFNNQELLERALTHSSAYKTRERTDYERLEFLGDAVLGLCVAHLISDRYPDATEGTLSKMRAAIVNTNALADVAKELEIGQYIRLGKGESCSGARERPSILADVMEALFGAIYRDSTYEKVFSLVEALLCSQLDKVKISDPKTELQELLHLEGSESPKYLVELVEGPVHAPTFVTVAIVDEQVVGRGRGSTKKTAQQNAATEVIGRLKYKYDSLELRAGQSSILPALLLVNDNLQDRFSVAQG